MRDAREMILAALEYGYEHCFVTAELIKKYAPEGPYSVFLCGPQQMYRFVDKELEKLGLERKYIRHELFGEFHDPKQKADYPSGAPDTVRIAVTVRGGDPDRHRLRQRLHPPNPGAQRHRRALPVPQRRVRLVPLPPDLRQGLHPQGPGRPAAGGREVRLHPPLLHLPPQRHRYRGASGQVRSS